VLKRCSELTGIKQFASGCFVSEKVMKRIHGPVRFIAGLVFLFYLALLSKNILFKKSPGYYKQYFRGEYRHYSVRKGWKQANTVPFSTIRLFYNSRHMSSDYKQYNLLGNLLGFLPFGLLLPLVLPWFRRLLLTCGAGFLLSAFYEISQLYFGLGVFDVDDLILNTAGVLAGYLLFLLGSLFFPKGKAAKMPAAS
jgi:glycopeptide antibiotics resistance protein